MNEQDVTVRLDDRIRLMSAVLALTNWPARSQAEQPHGTHAHSRLTRKYLEAYKEHPAVQGLQSLLNLGAPFEALYTFALQLSWPELSIEKLPVWVPPRWDDHLRGFYRQANLAQFWRDEDAPWRASVFEAQKMLKPAAFKPFLQPFLGDIPDTLVFMPNISFPTNREIGIRLDGELICIAPPRLAWGDSPPWPFDEDPAHVYRAALSQYGRLLILSFLRENAEALAPVAETPLPVSAQFRAQYPTWQEQFANLFVAAAAAMFLEQHVSKAEAKAFLLMERKTNGMQVLPGMISVLQRYLKERAKGRYHTLLDFMPIFPKQLRIANRIVTL